MAAQRLQVIEDQPHVRVADLVLLERWHRPHAHAHLRVHEEARQRLVVDGGAQASLAADVALVAMLVEEHLAALERRVGGLEGPCDRLTAARGRACEEGCEAGRGEDLQDGFHRAPPFTTRHSTPVSCCGAGPFSDISITPKSTT